VDSPPPHILAVADLEAVAGMAILEADMEAAVVEAEAATAEVVMVAPIVAAEGIVTSWPQNCSYWDRPGGL